MTAVAAADPSGGSAAARRIGVCWLAAVCWLGMGAGQSVGAPPPADAPPQPGESFKIILDTRSYWRAHVTLRPTLFGTRDDARQDKRGRIAGTSWSQRDEVLPVDGPNTPLPPAGWMQPEFDDSGWWRDPGPFFGGDIYEYEQRARPHEARYGWIAQPISLALVCVRGKFTVSDPARVRSLRLFAEFRGGAVAYLNGREVGRKHLPAGPIAPETLADDYPPQAYVNDKGVALYHWNPDSLAHKEEYRALREQAELRVRKFEELEIPVAGLRQGVNVLALEVHRAALGPEAMTTVHYTKGETRWNTLGLMTVRLSADGDGIVPNVGRPQAVQVWNANPVESVFDTDYGDPHEPLRAVRIPAARNGRFSGQVVVGSDQSLKNLTAEIGPLKQDGGDFVLPAARVRYPRAAIVEGGGKTVVGPLVVTYRFDGLEDAPPAEVKVKDLKNWRPRTPPASTPWLGAVQPVWLTVLAPKDAPAGTYRGTLTIRLDGAGPLAVPIEVQVHDFLLPDTRDLRTWVDFVEAPDNLAKHYNTALWSQEHWQHIERVMGYLAEVHNKTLYVPLICRTNHGNEQSMVRWLARPDGTYDYDYSVLERYIDTALRAGLAPEAIIFQVWDYHIGRDPSWKIGTGMYSQTTVNEAQPAPVSLLDRVTGRVAELLGPRYGTDEAEGFWRPVAEGVLERMRARGLDKVMLVGLSGDYVPTKECVHLWARLWPGAAWAAVAHGGAKDFYGVPIGYGVSVLWRVFAIDPDLRRTYGWMNPRRDALFDRYKGQRDAQIAFDRIAAEISLISNLRGPGRLGGDNFLWRGRYGGTQWGSIALPAALLAPGAAGPVSTCRFEMLREGVQECEARIFLEQMLLNPDLTSRLDASLRAHCQKLLDERTRCLIWADETNTNGRNHSSLPVGPLGFDWYAGSGWQERAGALFGAAADVAAALGTFRLPTPPPVPVVAVGPPAKTPSRPRADKAKDPTAPGPAAKAGNALADGSVSRRLTRISPVAVGLLTAAVLGGLLGLGLLGLMIWRRRENGNRA